MKNTTTLILLSILLSGCTPAGYFSIKKNGRDVNQIERNTDFMECQREAAKLFPFASAIQGSSNQNLTSQCYSIGGSSIQCQGSGGGTTIVTQDGNELNRNQFIRSCILAKGYVKTWIPNQESYSPKDEESTEINSNKTTSAETKSKNLKNKSTPPQRNIKKIKK